MLDTVGGSTFQRCEWILHGRTGEPVDLGNARKRWLHPTAALIGVKVGGWHDFRHTLKRQMRRAKEDPVIVRDTFGTFTGGTTGSLR